MSKSIKIILIVIILLAVGLSLNMLNNVEVPEETKKEFEITYKNSSEDLIQVELPYPGAVTGKEFKIIGKARGYWFFEASFPVELRSLDGNILGGGVATAEGDWMTEDFVNFTAEMQTPSAFIGPAILILKKDNPSGEPQNDASISFPITVEY